jgi:hypothetical protein
MAKKQGDLTKPQMIGIIRAARSSEIVIHTDVRIEARPRTARWIAPSYTWFKKSIIIALAAI